MATDYRSITENPEALSRLITAARRERAREMHRLVFAPLIALFRRPKKLRASRMIRSQAYC
jgi:hypothetical protein